jgi:hypothetical protein
MEGRDRHAVFQIEAMRRMPVRCRVQMQLIASEAASLPEQPLHQRVGVPSSPETFSGDEVVDVQERTPGKIVARSETSNRSGILLTILEGGE